MKKEQLLQQNTEQQKDLDFYQQKDEKLREEFAKAFGWFEERDDFPAYRRVPENPKTPTWEEIFVEVGKLLKIQNVKNIEYRINNIEEGMERVSKEIHNIKSNYEKQSNK